MGTSRQPQATDTAHAISPDSQLHWTEPGAWQVAPGVHRIPLPLPTDGLRGVNVYVLEAGDGLTLVDGGWAIEVSRTLLEKSLAELGYALGDIRRFLVTHMHRDHYTQAVTVRREVGSHVSLGLGDKPSLDFIHGAGDTGRHPFSVSFLAAGAPDLARWWEEVSRDSPPETALWDYPDAWLEGDVEVAAGERTLDAVHTPGHTQGHYVFADRPAGLLFAGDHVLPTITPSIGFEPQPVAQPLGDFLGSLAKVRSLPDLTLLPAHGPIAPSSHARVDQLLAHHDHRLRQCLEAVPDTEGRTAYQIAAALPWTRHEHALTDLDPFNAGLATLETRAHAELLVARGQLRRTVVDGVAVYVRGTAPGSRRIGRCATPSSTNSPPSTSKP